ncbi:MAG: hypothetical protein EXX96DRAFT_612727 [Benjaminiella poitrasii]|nr:MAG: hypothetical protein EXX96DRAFT_612727 [Benjaminiella poitrasii]
MTKSESDENENQILNKMLEIGFVCCSSQSSVRDLLANQTITEKDVGEILGSMARTYVNTAGVGNNGNASEVIWNVENFVMVIKEKTPELDWIKVFEYLDYPHFYLFDGKGLDILVKAWRAHSIDSHFPANVFFGEWKNVRGQLTALYQIAQSSPKVINCALSSKRTVIKIGDFTQCAPNIRSTVSQLVKSQLNSLDLIERIIKLADTFIADDVKALIEKIMMKKTPELFFMGLFQIDPIINSTQEEMLKRLMNFYLAGNSSSVLVFTKLWKIKPELFKRSIIEWYEKEPTALSRILAFIQELKVLPIVLEVPSFLFSIDLAALATRREFLNLERWLQDKIAKHGNIFIQSCLKFLETKARAESARHESNSAPVTVPLSMDVVNIFIKVYSEIDCLNTTEKELLRDVHLLYTELANKSATLFSNERPVTDAISANTNTISVESDSVFKKDIEKEVCYYLERVYNNEIMISDVVSRLKQLRISNNPRDRDVYACLICYIFEEYRFFHKYPDKQLNITSALFGSLIQNRLIPHDFLAVALNCILESLKSPPTSKMYIFGVQAIAQFEARLVEWPQFCEQALQIPTIQQTDPKITLVMRVFLQMEKIRQQQYVNIETQSSNQSNSVTRKYPENPSKTFSDKAISGIFTAINVPKIALDKNVIYETPNETIQGKILFIINNVASNNLETKLVELKEHLKQPFYIWFSSYLVVKRVSIEPNYHELYICLLKAFNSKSLYNYILRETLTNIKILLNSDNTLSSSSDRSLLKNLGAWLGGITLANNRPIIQKHISFKDLLLEGYHSNRLLVIIPFVCKVLEQGKKNTVFLPHNPWVKAILKLLVELYEHANLKLNLKFEIEVLCKSLSIELSSIEPTTILMPNQFKHGKQMVDMNSIASSANAGQSNNYDAHYEQTFQPYYCPDVADLLSLAVIDEESIIADIPDLGPFLSFNSQMAMYTAQPASKNWVLQAITQALHEVVLWFGDRLIKSAIMSTYELVTKGFGSDSDELNMRKSAQIMVQTLVSNLTRKNCKEPLQVNMIRYMCSIFVTNGLNAMIAESTALVTAADNLDIICTIIERLLLKNVMIKIDEILIIICSDRRKYNEQQQYQPDSSHVIQNTTQSSYIDTYMGFKHSTKDSEASDASILNKRMIEYQQYLLEQQYISYANYPEMQQNSFYNNSSTSIAPPNQFNSNNNNVLQQQHQISPANQIIIDKFFQNISELEKLFSMTNITSFDVLPAHHDIFALANQIPYLTMSSFDVTEIAKIFGQKLIHLAFKTETQLGKETYYAILEGLCNISPNIRKLITSWMSNN